MYSDLGVPGRGSCPRISTSVITGSPSVYYTDPLLSEFVCF